MFKKGDKVRRVSGISKFNPYYGGEPFILSVKKHGFWCDPNGDGHYEDNLELMISTEEQAKATLEALGYTITLPKPKEVIEVVLCKNNTTGRLETIIKIRYDMWDEHIKSDYPIIAIATITEGDGL